TAASASAPARSRAVTSRSTVRRSSFDPAAAIAHRSREPYAATLETSVEAGEGAEKEVTTVTGRSNHNTPAEGARAETKMVRGALVLAWEETVTIDQAIYRRNKETGETTWTRDEKPPAQAGKGVEDNDGYARVLLDAGPAARKGMETEAGVPVFHLAARLSADQLRRANPKYGDGRQNQGVDGADVQLWIDRLGRVVRGEVSTVVAGKPAVTKERYTDFGPAETFTPPAAG
ncbi:WW domain-containing protein, partial [Kitasatospora sp. NPDC036755]|uniref:WW domain-containing protein n=1 Tax=Kitasatospora sp. NPDC036755 TaxID=3154600 RepID=UPI0033CDA514